MDAVGREIVPPLLVRVSKSRVPTSRVSTSRRRAHRQAFVLNVSLRFPLGITILFGPSGAGKSTLLDCIAGLLRPDTGRVSLGEEILFDSAAAVNIPVHARRMGYVFQTPALFPHLTVEENVGYGIVHVPPTERKQRIEEILAAFRVAELRQRKPSEISGGEAQRVELARSLVTNPRVLLLDEPMSALDEDLKTQIIEDLRAWRAARSIPIVYVTHSRTEAKALGDRVVTMDSGTIVSEAAEL